jgi:hypothetical protein
MAGRAGGGRRLRTGCAGPKGLELGQLRKNSKENSNWAAKAIWAEIKKKKTWTEEMIFGFYSSLLN